MEAIGKAMQRNPLVSGDTETIKEQIREMQIKLQEYKCRTRMNYPEFKELLTTYATEIMIRRSIIVPYVIDKNNGPVIRNLYLYFTNSDECRWNLNSGLLFGGKVGCGKSILMMAFLRITDEYSLKRTATVHSKALAKQLKVKGLDFYERRPMFIDELGREETETKDYGNVIKPIIDLFALRYEAGSRTYATTNFKYDTLEKFYGDFVRSRMEEMMTYVHIPGESRRLKNEF
jgi:DNA replication protein DnaC